MNSKMLKPISNITQNRVLFIELAVVAILLSAAINVITSVILSMNIINSIILLWISIGFLSAATIYFATKYLWLRENNIAMRGFLLCNNKSNFLIEDARYDYMREMCNYLKFACNENKAIENIWKSSPLSNMNVDIHAIRTGTNKNKSAIIVKEMSEYYVLQKLSIHLRDYFDNSDYLSNKVETFARKDIPEVLLSNRFLELFSAPTENRPVFSDNSHPTSDVGEVIVAMSQNGCFFNKFDLTVPKNTKVIRGKDGEVIIETNRFVLEIKIKFEGFNTNIPWEYIKNILENDHEDCGIYNVEICFNTKFKFASLFLPGGWVYYKWLESFFESIENDFSKDKYFSSIGWETVLSIMQYNNALMKIKSE
jgi:hypothetical protein